MILPRCLVSICSDVDEHYKEFKEGGHIMVEVRTRAKKGLEDLYDLVIKKIDELDEEIKKEFETRKAELVELLKQVSEDYEVEVAQVAETDFVNEFINPSEAPVAEDNAIIV